MLNAVEPGTVVLEMKDGRDEAGGLMKWVSAIHGVCMWLLR